MSFPVDPDGVRKFATYVMLLAACVAGVAAIGNRIVQSAEPRCPAISADEIAISRSRLGFRQDFLTERSDKPQCDEFRFSGELRFKERDLRPGDVVEIAAQAGWTAVEDSSLISTCFASERAGWERIQLKTYPRLDEPVRSIEVSFNLNGACRDEPS